MDSYASCSDLQFIFYILRNVKVMETLSDSCERIDSGGGEELLLSQ